MKSNIIKFCTIAFTVATFAACTGNSTRNGKDTSDVKYSETPQGDTNKVTTTTGDAPNLDNSGNGGTKVAKDSVLKQDSVQK